MYLSRKDRRFLSKGERTLLEIGSISSYHTKLDWIQASGAKTGRPAFIELPPSVNWQQGVVDLSSTSGLWDFNRHLRAFQVNEPV